VLGQDWIFNQGVWGSMTIHSEKAPFDVKFFDRQGDYKIAPKDMKVTVSPVIAYSMDTFMLFFYGTDTVIPLLDEMETKKNFSFAEKGNELLLTLRKDAYNQVVYTLDGKTKVIKKRERTGRVRVSEQQNLFVPIHSVMVVKKKKSVDGVEIPTVIEHEYNSISPSVEGARKGGKKEVSRLVLDEESIKINRPLDAKDSLMTIPSGVVVRDLREGTPIEASDLKNMLLFEP
jgi:hypothetical protein